MDLILRGRGADISARAPLWLVRLCGAVLAFAAFVLADRLGLTEATGFSGRLLGFGALIFGALVAPTSFGIVLWVVTGLLVVTVCTVAFTPLVNAPARSYVRRDTSNAHIDAVVVLSGSMNDDGLISREVLTRFIAGLAVARERQVGTVALSVLDGDPAPIRITSEADQRALMAVLAPDVAVEFVRNVRSTRDEALQFAALARTNGWQRVALVTSAVHSRRSCRTFEAAGLPVTCLPARSREFSEQRGGGPNARLDVFRDMVYETAASLLYAARGWI